MLFWARTHSQNNSLAMAFDPQLVVKCINDVVLGQDTQTINNATAQLQYLQDKPGFIFFLATVLCDRGIQEYYRQSAGMFMRDAVKLHWAIVSPEEQAQIRNALLQALSDPSGKVRSAVSAAIAAIGKHDFPAKWPELIPTMHQLLLGSSADGVHGGLRCLESIISQVSDQEVPYVVPTLAPILHSLYCNGAAPLHVRSRAAQIFHLLLEVMGMAVEQFKKEVTQILKEILPQWLEPIAQALALPAGPGPDFSLHLSSLKIIKVLIEVYKAAVLKPMKSMLPAIWNLLLSAAAVYEDSCVFSEADQVQDSDMENAGVEALVEQSLELLTTMTRSRFARTLHSSLPAICHITITYMQMTSDQEEIWSTDANAFIADDEDDSWAYTTRVCAADLFTEIVEVYGEDGLRAIINAAFARMADAAQRQQAGHPQWWKLREACLLAIGSISDDILDALEDEVAVLDVHTLLGQTLISDLSAESHEFLRGRALWLASRLSSVVPVEMWGPYAKYAVDSLDTRVSMPVRVCACRALAKFAKLDGALLVQWLPQIIGGVCALDESPAAGENTEDIVTLVLEILARMLRLDQQKAAEHYAKPMAIAMRVWVQNNEDATMIDCCCDVFDALAANPYTREVVQQTMVPMIVKVMHSPETHADGMLAAAMELLTKLVQHGDGNTAIELIDQLLPMLLKHMTVKENTAALQNGCDCLSAILKAGGEAVVSSCGGQGLQIIMHICTFMLSPEVSDQARLYLPPLLIQLIRRVPQHIMPLLPSVLGSVVDLFLRTNHPPFKSFLNLVLAQLAFSNAADLINFLGGLSQDILSAVLREWTHHFQDTLTTYRRKLHVVALANILALNDPRVMGVAVRGQMIVDTSQARQTRASSRGQTAQYTTVPFVQKVLELLAEQLMVSGDDEEADGANEYVFPSRMIHYMALCLFFL
eukprot:TRINITY_DN974_c0_g1_i2.p1 TRINITY_DN974_c0_g1~~TRINITY_DN974_c0_g1_i2.p1  ORF type:complete len:932 (-),score=219.47 TRINITY_DN974_c0_g1_i2:531-3326(-)